MSLRLPDEGRYGPRKSPYDSGLSRWQGIEDDPSIWLPDALAAGAYVEHVPEIARAAYIAFRIMQEVRVPLLRRFLKMQLQHQGRFAPNVADRALNDLRTYVPTAVIQEVFRRDNESDSHLYGLRPAAVEEIAALGDLLDLERQTLSIPVLGKVAERFVRACFVRSGRYTNVTRPTRLGYVTTAPGMNRLDLMVTDTTDGRRWAVSVKNQRDFLRRRHEWILDVIQMAKRHDAQPWLVPSFSTADGVQACFEQGIRCTPMNARIAPAESDDGRPMRSLLQAFYPVNGGEPYILMGKARLLPGQGDSFIDALRTVTS